jgi:hypothetical protein
LPQLFVESLFFDTQFIHVRKSLPFICNGIKNIEALTSYAT